MRNQITEEGVDLIKSFEACKLKAYDDGVGVWTIGWGHTEGVKRGQTITQAQADRFFDDDLDEFADGVASLITTRINDNQFSAVVSLAFNIGLAALKRSTLLRHLNAGNFSAAANEFLKWNKGGGKVMRGLTRRREAERKLFLTPLALAVQPEPVEEPMTDNIRNAVAGSEPSPPPQAQSEQPVQTVDSASTGTQVNVTPNTLAEPAKPIVSEKGDEQQQATQGGFKSMVTSVVGWVTGAGAGVIALLKDNQTLLIIAAILVALAGLVYFIRQLVLDYKRLEIAADPTKFSSK